QPSCPWHSTERSELRIQAGCTEWTGRAGSRQRPEGPRRLAAGRGRPYHGSVALFPGRRPHTDGGASFQSPVLRRGGTLAQATLNRPPPRAITQTKLLINTQWVAPAEGKHFDTLNPATGQVIAKVAEAGPADGDKAVKAARRALESGPWATMDAA